jgi:hypothetical protein
MTEASLFRVSCPSWKRIGIESVVVGLCGTDIETLCTLYEGTHLPEVVYLSPAKGDWLCQIPFQSGKTASSSSCAS